MKKISLLVVLSLIVVLGAFANNPSTSFNVGTFIGERTGLIVHDNDSNQNVTYPTDATSWSALSAVGTSDDPIWLVQDDQGGSQAAHRVVAVSVMTNKAGNQTVTATAGPMVEDNDASKKIGFKVTVASEETTVAKGDNSKVITLIDLIPNVSELTFVTQEFRIDINAADYESALMGRYTSTWTIELKSV